MKVLLATLVVALVGCVDITPVEPVNPTELDATVVTEPGQDPQRPVAAPEVTTVTCEDEATAAGGQEGGEVRDVRCGLVVVPEDPASPRGPIVEVAFIRITAAEERTGPPLIVVPDGPGASGLAELPRWLASPLSRSRDVVLVDPRGVGQSFPALDCGPGNTRDRMTLQAVAACRAALAAQGVDLTSYHTTAIARDLVSLAQALELDRVDLIGIGHGARVVQGVLALAPERVRAVVLDSPVPDLVDVYRDVGLNAQSALNRLLDQCAQDTGCADRFGEAIDTLNTTLETQNQVAGGSGDPQPSGDQLAVALVDAMRRSDGISSIPAVIAQISVDPVGALERLTAPADDEPSSSGAAPGSESEQRSAAAFSEGLLFSSECHDEVPFSRFDPDDPPRGLDVVGQAVTDQYAIVPAACPVWEAGVGSEQAGGETDVFALVLNGEFDPLVSPAWAAQATRDIPDAAVVQIDAAGHRLVDLDDCTTALVGAFLAQPGLDSDALAAAVAEDVAGCPVVRDVDFDLS